MEIISALPLHPKNKLLIYQRYVLSKVSWDLTVANISMTWVKENLENKVSAYVRLWLELPISGTLDIISLTKSKYGLGYVPISSRFTQCQVTFRKALSKSTNKDIQHLFESTSTGPNLQYDQYLSTKDAIMKIRSMKEKRVENELKRKVWLFHPFGSTCYQNRHHCGQKCWKNYLVTSIILQYDT